MSTYFKDPLVIIQVLNYAGLPYIMNVHFKKFTATLYSQYHIVLVHTHKAIHILAALNFHEFRKKIPVCEYLNTDNLPSL